MKPKVKKIVLLVPAVIGIGVCVWGFVLRAGVTHTSHGNYTQNQEYPRTITINKTVWVEINTTGKNFRSVSLNPPVRRLVMVNNDTDRVIPLPARIDNTINLGARVKSLRFKIDPSESLSSSEFKYELN